jgi:hypothetical protein
MCAREEKSLNRPQFITQSSSSSYDYDIYELLLTLLVSERGTRGKPTCREEERNRERERRPTAVPLMNRQRNDERLMHRNKPLNAKNILLNEGECYRSRAMYTRAHSERGDLIIPPFPSINQIERKKS